MFAVKNRSSVANLLYTGIYSPPFYFRFFCPRCQRAHLRLGEFQYLRLFLFKHNYVWADSRCGETICK